MNSTLPDTSKSAIVNRSAASHSRALSRDSSAASVLSKLPQAYAEGFGDSISKVSPEMPIGNRAELTR